jgi:hypothetical protein
MAAILSLLNSMEKLFASLRQLMVKCLAPVDTPMMVVG